MEIDQVTSFVTNFGFPMALSIYLLVRVESKMDNLATVIQDLSKMIEKVCDNK